MFEALTAPILSLMDSAGIDSKHCRKHGAQRARWEIPQQLLTIDPYPPVKWLATDTHPPTTSFYLQHH